MPEQSERERFEQAVVPHLDSAYNLARWLTRNEHDAEDLVQESCMRAWKFFDGFRGGDSRPWLLAIVRNTCYAWFRKNRMSELATPFDEAFHGGSDAASPEAQLIESADGRMIHEALDQLPVEFREVMVLRELEGLSYKEIAGIAHVPIGTVMSRLARARQRLQQILAPRFNRESTA